MSGTSIKQVLNEAGIWITVFAIGFGSFYYFDSLSGVMTRVLEIGEDKYRLAKSQNTAVAKEVEAEPDYSRYEERIQAGRNGHFFTTAEINGQDIEVLVDTGASAVALTYEDANAIGLFPTEQEFTIRLSTANGISLGAPAELDSVEIGDIEVRNVRAIITQPGATSITLLGMSFIKKLERVELEGGELVLVQ